MATVHRFFVEEPLRGGEVALAARIVHQAGAVLRLRPGDPLVLFDGSGGEWTAQLVACDRREARARLLRLECPEREPALRLTLGQALLKADRFEWVLQKGTELGVAAFQPLLTRRTVPAGDGGGAPGRLARWRRIVVEAAEQCGRCLVPPVAEPLPFKAALDGGPPTVLCWEGERTTPFLEAVDAAAATGDGVRLLIGPEGGFDPQEVRAAAAAGARPASLGARLLRSETAALAATSLALLAPRPPRRPESPPSSPAALPTSQEVVPPARLA